MWKKPRLDERCNSGQCDHDRRRRVFDKVIIVNGVKESGRAREEISLAGIDNSTDFSLSGKKLPPFIQGRQGETFCKVPLGKQGELSRSDGGDFL